MRLKEIDTGEWFIKYIKYSIIFQIHNYCFSNFKSFAFFSIAVQFDFSPKCIGKVAGTEFFPTLPRNHALALRVPDLDVPPHLLVKGPCPRIDRNLFVPGFPTFRHIQFTIKFESIGVKVFDSPAAKDRPTLLLYLKECPLKTVEDCKDLLGKPVWVNFPHLQEALVEAVMDRQTSMRISRINGNQEIIGDATDEATFAKDAKTVHER